LPDEGDDGVVGMSADGGDVIDDVITTTTIWRRTTTNNKRTLDGSAPTGRQRAHRLVATDWRRPTGAAAFITHRSPATPARLACTQPRRPRFTRRRRRSSDRSKLTID